MRWGKTGKCGDTAPVDLAELGQLGNESSGNDWAHAWCGPQPPINGGQLGVGRHKIGNPCFDLCDPAIEQSDDTADVGASHGVRSLLEAGGFLLAHLDELAAARRLRLERAAFWGQGLGWSGCQTCAQFGEHSCINTVGLADDAHRLREVARLPRIDATEANLRGSSASRSW